MSRDVAWQEDGAEGSAACACGWTVAVGPYGSLVRCDLALQTSIALHLDRMRLGGGLAGWVLAK